MHTFAATLSAPAATSTQALAPAGLAPAAACGVLVVEDHELMREALERRLGATDDFHVAAMADTVESAAAAFAATRPDVVLVDHTLPDGSGMDVLREVRTLDPEAVVVMLSGHDDPALISGYLARGANGYAHKTINAAELLRVLRSALAGETALDAVASRSVVAQLREPAVAPVAEARLSPREVEVLTLVADGLTNEDVASRLFISGQTVKTHLTRIFGKLGVDNRAAAAVTASRLGVI